MNIYLMYYIQIGIAIGVLHGVKDLIWTIRNRKKTHKLYLDYLNGIDNKYYIKQTFDVRKWTEDYLSIPLGMIFFDF